jgi:hypothetical protein
MAFQHNTIETDATSAHTLRDSLTSLIATIGTALRTGIDGYNAAALYEQLNGLSDAELARRGLSRPTLARDALAACDRGSAGR